MWLLCSKKFPGWKIPWGKGCDINEHNFRSSHQQNSTYDSPVIFAPMFLRRPRNQSEKPQEYQQWHYLFLGVFLRTTQHGSSLSRSCSCFFISPFLQTSPQIWYTMRSYSTHSILYSGVVYDSGHELRLFWRFHISFRSEETDHNGVHLFYRDHDHYLPARENTLSTIRSAQAVCRETGIFWLCCLLAQQTLLLCIRCYTAAFLDNPVTAVPSRQCPSRWKIPAYPVFWLTSVKPSSSLYLHVNHWFCLQHRKNPDRK